MSYILDALRRAESERERGQVPGLHAQPLPIGLGVKSGRPGAPLVRWLAGAALLAIAGAGAWWWASSPAAAPAAPSVPAPPQAQSAPPAPGAAASEAMPPPAAAEATPPPLLVAPPLPEPTPGELAEARRRAAAEPARVPRDPPLSPPVAPAAAAAVAAPAPAPSAAAQNPAMPATPLASLPAAQRAELPPMSIGGAVYSEQPSSRFLLINGLVVREGETAAPGVVLERIGPKSAIVRWRELRILVPI